MLDVGKHVSSPLPAIENNIKRSKIFFRDLFFFGHPNLTVPPLFIQGLLLHLLDEVEAAAFSSSLVLVTLFILLLSLLLALKDLRNSILSICSRARRSLTDKKSFLTRINA